MITFFDDISSCNRSSSTYEPGNDYAFGAEKAIALSGDERRLPFSMELTLAVDRVRRMDQESIAPLALKELTTQSGVMTKMLKPPRMNRPNVRFTGMFVNTVT